MSEMLPKGWVKTTIGSLGTISTGNTPSRRDGTNYGKGIPFVRPGDLGNGAVVTNTSEMLSEKGAKSARLLAPNAVMITCIGNLGKVGIAGRTLCTNQQINSVQFFKDYIVSRFGYYRCLRLKEWLEQQSSATTLPIVNKSRFSAAPFPLPPLNEQKRIAAKLDKIIPRIDKVKERLDKIPVITKRFRQSVLAAAVTGKLTEEWREENPDVERSEGKEIVNIKIKFDVPSTWDFRKLDEFIQEIKAGKNFSCPEIPLVSV